MPKLADAAVLAVGTIINIEPSFVYNDDKTAPKVQDGLRLLIGTGEGFVSVKLSTDLANQLKPTSGQNVAWYLRYGATGGGDRGASSYSTFVRLATPDDLDRLVALVKRG